MLERIRAAIAAMQETVRQLEEGLVTAREARDKCMDETAQRLLSEDAEMELGEAEQRELCGPDVPPPTRRTLQLERRGKATTVELMQVDLTEGNNGNLVAIVVESDPATS